MALVLRLVIVALLIMTGCNPAPISTATPQQTQAPEPTATVTIAPPPTLAPNLAELTRAADPTQLARVSIMHAASVPALDLYIEGMALATRLVFSQATQPNNILAGDYVLRVRLSDQPSDAAPLQEFPVTLPATSPLLFVLTGDADNLTLSYYPLDLSPLPSETSRITFINTMPSSMITLLHNNQPVSAPQSYTSAAEPVTVISGNATLTLQDNTGETRYTAEQNLLPHTAYILAAASTADGPILMESRLSVPGLAHIRALNIAEQASALSVYLNNQPIVENLEYTRRSEAQPYTAEVYTVTIFAADADPATDQPLVTSQLVANTDDFITLLIMGTPDNLQLITYREDTSPTPADSARVAFVNSLPQAGRARIQTQNGPLSELPNLAYAQAPTVTDLRSGTYNFSWMAVEDNNLLEDVADVILEPGRSYIYLLTGRMLQPPLILSDNVGTMPAPTPVPEALIESAASVTDRPTQLRFINAIQGSTPLSISVDQQQLFIGLEYGATTAIIELLPGDHQIGFNRTDNGQTVYDTDVALAEQTPHTLVIYGTATGPVESLLTEDTGLSMGSAPTLRLFNLTISGDATLGLAYSPTDPLNTPASHFAEIPQSETFRRSMAFGIQKVLNLNEISKLNVSDFSIAPVGMHDLHIIDATRNEIAASIRTVNLEVNHHYDVIAFQYPNSLRIEAFVLPYPAS